jgi:hypothetical protein
MRAKQKQEGPVRALTWQLTKVVDLGQAKVFLVEEELRTHSHQSIAFK